MLYIEYSSLGSLVKLISMHILASLLLIFCLFDKIVPGTVACMAFWQGIQLGIGWSGLQIVFHTGPALSGVQRMMELAIYFGKVRTSDTATTESKQKEWTAFAQKRRMDSVILRRDYQCLMPTICASVPPVAVAAMADPSPPFPSMRISLTICS